MECKFFWHPQFKSKMTDMDFNNIFYLTQYMQSIINLTCNQYKKLLRYFTLLSFHTKSCVNFYCRLAQLYILLLLLFSHSVMSNSLQPRRL